ncbi:MAG: hypothetical protein FWD71_04260 [Oscillospiraceae bacterium]|nr:hypothetical protein [Oscillospiraceae bacterium]
MNNKEMITELTDKQIDDLLSYTPPYTEQNAANIKALALEKIKPKKKKNHKPYYRLILITAAVMLMLSIGAGAYYLTGIIVTKNNGVISESMNYEFIPDEEAVGTWTVVDFVKNIDDFEAGTTQWDYTTAPFYWLNVMLYNDGTALSTFDGGIIITTEWTKGYIVQGDVIPAYTIKNIDGSDYMFVQWKSGDYTMREMTPYYYVFKKTSPDVPDQKEYSTDNFNKLVEERRNDDPNITVNVFKGRIYDTMDYKFIPDEEAAGTWNVVDFVKNIGDFEAGTTQWGSTNFYWLNVAFSDDGTALSTFDGGTTASNQWTKGYIVQGDVIPSYTIKNIDGAEYMFIQWKSGDYSIRGMKPYYYVFQKQ